MTNDTETPISCIDRRTASKLNPFICDIDALGTCDNVSSAMRTLAYMVSAFQDSPVELNATDFYFLQGTLAAALEYETAQKEPKPEAKEASVKRIK